MPPLTNADQATHKRLQSEIDQANRNIAAQNERIAK